MTGDLDRPIFGLFGHSDIYRTITPCMVRLRHIWDRHGCLGLGGCRIIFTPPLPNSHTPPPTLTVMATTATEHFTYLWCIAINKRRKVLCKPFQILARLKDDCAVIPVHLRLAIPSLRSEENKISSIHMPCRVMLSSEEMPEILDEEFVHTTTVVRREALVEDIFPFVPVRKHQEMNIIINLSNSGAYFVILSALLNVFDAFTQN